MFTQLIGFAIANRLFGVRSTVLQNQIDVKCVILAVSLFNFAKFCGVRTKPI